LREKQYARIKFAQQSIRNLPIDRRDYLSFTLLAPGVVDANALADNTDFRVAQTLQSGISFYGSNGRGNSVTVDGAEATHLFLRQFNSPQATCFTLTADL